MTLARVAKPEALHAILTDCEIRLEPLEERHLEDLRAACAQDREIWEVYPHSMLDEHFDQAIVARLATPGSTFAACKDDEVVGITAYLRPDGANGTVEIGGTYIVPAVRGTDYNRRVKQLLIDHAFACGFHRIEFRVDERNRRSQAAVMKLGAKPEGVLRRDRITWTGHVRNTCIFSLLREEWNI